MGSWRGALGRLGLEFTRVPSADQDHGLATAPTEDGFGRKRFFEFMNRSQIGYGLPGFLFGLSQTRCLPKQGPNSVELSPSARMKPTKESDTMKSLWKNVLKESPDDFEGFQIEVVPSSGRAVAVMPSPTPLGLESEARVGGGGLKDVTAQILQSRGARSDRAKIHDPLLSPNPCGDAGQRRRIFPSEGLGKEGSEMIGHRPLGQEKSTPVGEPLTLIVAQTASGNEVMNVGMIDQSAAPGVENTEHPQCRPQSIGVPGQILQGAGAGFKEKTIPQGGMGTNPLTQGLGHREGDQEIARGQEQLGMMIQPGLGILLTATGTMPVIAGMIGIVVSLTVRAPVKTAPTGGGAATENLGQDLTLTDGHGRAKGLQINRPPTEQELMELNRFAHARRRGRAHGRGYRSAMN